MNINGAIKINNKDYLMKFDMNTVCAVKATEDLNIFMLDETQMADPLVLRTLFYHGLQAFHRKEVKTKEMAGELMSDYFAQGGTLQDLFIILNKSIASALGLSAMIEGK